VVSVVTSSYTVVGPSRGGRVVPDIGEATDVYLEEEFCDGP
jgi:hypothetical protein